MVEPDKKLNVDMITVQNRAKALVTRCDWTFAARRLLPNVILNVSGDATDNGQRDCDSVQDVAQRKWN